MNPDSAFVETHPKNSDRISRPGRNIEVIIAPITMLQHRFIPTEPRESSDTNDFPSADRSGESGGTRSDRLRTNNLSAAINIEHAVTRIDLDHALAEFGPRRNVICLFDLFDLELRNIRYPHDVPGVERINLLVLIQFGNELRIGMKAFTEKFAVRTIEHCFLLRLFGRFRWNVSDFLQVLSGECVIRIDRENLR